MLQDWVEIGPKKILDIAVDNQVYCIIRKEGEALVYEDFILQIQKNQKENKLMLKKNVKYSIDNQITEVFVFQKKIFFIKHNQLVFYPIEADNYKEEQKIEYQKAIHSYNVIQDRFLIIQVGFNKLFIYAYNQLEQLQEIFSHYSSQEFHLIKSYSKLGPNKYNIFIQLQNKELMFISILKNLNNLQYYCFLNGFINPLKLNIDLVIENHQSSSIFIRIYNGQLFFYTLCQGTQDFQLIIKIKLMNLLILKKNKPFCNQIQDKQFSKEFCFKNVQFIFYEKLKKVQFIDEQKQSNTIQIQGIDSVDIIHSEFIKGKNANQYLIILLSQKTLYMFELNKEQESIKEYFWFYFEQQLLENEFQILCTKLIKQRQKLVVLIYNKLQKSVLQISYNLEDNSLKDKELFWFWDNLKETYKIKAFIFQDLKIKIFALNSQQEIYQVQQQQLNLLFSLYQNFNGDIIQDFLINEKYLIVFSQQYLYCQSLQQNTDNKLQRIDYSQTTKCQLQLRKLSIKQNDQIKIKNNFKQYQIYFDNKQEDQIKKKHQSDKQLYETILKHLFIQENFDIIQNFYGNDKESLEILELINYLCKTQQNQQNINIVESLQQLHYSKLISDSLKQNVDFIINNYQELDLNAKLFVINHKDQQLNDFDILNLLLTESQRLIQPTFFNGQQSLENILKNYLIFWLQNTEQLATIIDKTVISEYQKTKEIQDLMIYFILLNKQKVLSQLVKRHPNFVHLESFFNLDFDQAKYKKQAQQNAFVLKSQLKYSLSAALFILGQDYIGAITLSLFEWNNSQMAVLIYWLLQKWLQKDEQILIQIKEIFYNYFKKYSKITQVIICIILEDYYKAKEIILDNRYKSSLQLKDQQIFLQEDNIQHFERFIKDLSGKQIFEGVFKEEELQQSILQKQQQLIKQGNSEQFIDLVQQYHEDHQQTQNQLQEKLIKIFNKVIRKEIKKESNKKQFKTQILQLQILFPFYQFQGIYKHQLKQEIYLIKEIIILSQLKEDYLLARNLIEKIYKQLYWILRANLAQFSSIILITQIQYSYLDYSLNQINGLLTQNDIDLTQQLQIQLSYIVQDIVVIKSLINLQRNWFSFIKSIEQERDALQDKQYKQSLQIIDQKLQIVINIIRIQLISHLLSDIKDPYLQQLVQQALQQLNQSLKDSLQDLSIFQKQEIFKALQDFLSNANLSTEIIKQFLQIISLEKEQEIQSVINYLNKETNIQEFIDQKLKEIEELNKIQHNQNFTQFDQGIILYQLRPQMIALGIISNQQVQKIISFIEGPFLNVFVFIKGGIRQIQLYQKLLGENKNENQFDNFDNFSIQNDHWILNSHLQSQNSHFQKYLKNLLQSIQNKQNTYLVSQISQNKQSYANLQGIQLITSSLKYPLFFISIENQLQILSTSLLTCLFSKTFQGRGNIEQIIFNDSQMKLLLVFKDGSILLFQLSFNLSDIIKIETIIENVQQALFNHQGTQIIFFTNLGQLQVYSIIQETIIYTSSQAVQKGTFLYALSNNCIIVINQWQNELLIIDQNFSIKNRKISQQEDRQILCHYFEQATQWLYILYNDYVIELFDSLQILKQNNQISIQLTCKDEGQICNIHITEGFLFAGYSNSQVKLLGKFNL